MSGEIVNRRFICVKDSSDVDKIDEYVHDLYYDIESMVACNDCVYVYIVKRE